MTPFLKMYYLLVFLSKELPMIISLTEKCSSGTTWLEVQKLALARHGAPIYLYVISKFNDFLIMLNNYGNIVVILL